MTVQEMGTRLMAGQQTLNLYVEVRLLCAQLFYLKTPSVIGGVYSFYLYRRHIKHELRSRSLYLHNCI